MVTTWLSDVGVVCCSCVGRTAHVGRLRSSSKDATCVHSKNFIQALHRLCSRMGVSSSSFRVQIPQVFNLGGAGAGAAGPASAAQAPETGKWDVEGPIETFRAGQGVLAVVVSGLGPCKVVAPVICARKTTSCSFCDTARGFSCVHAVRCRSIRRGDAASRKLPAGTKDDAGMDAARSQLPILLYDRPKSVTVDARVCQLMKEGKALVVEAAKICPTCGATPDPSTITSEAGEIMCSLGYCAMELQCFVCSSPHCQRRI